MIRIGTAQVEVANFATSTWAVPIRIIRSFEEMDQSLHLIS
jgi:hypothetical protein